MDVDCIFSFVCHQEHIEEGQMKGGSKRMKNIWLVDFDGKIENLALMRLSTYWKQRDAHVELKHGALNRAGEVTDSFLFPSLLENPDKVYISCLFRWHRDAALQLTAAWGDRAEVGGTGVDYSIKLPEEVAACEPDYTLYGEERAIGFISRGCPNRCPWCVVWRKEGELHRVSTAQALVGERTELLALDNNFLGLPDHLDDLRWLVENEVPVDFNQGLDARLVTEENASLLAKAKWLAGGPRFALDGDYDGQKDALARTLDLLERFGLSRNTITVFVLIGFSGKSSDVERLIYVHQLGARVFPMGYRHLKTGDEPATGWNRPLYKKYKRLICRIPHATSVWADFEREVEYGES